LHFFGQWLNQFLKVFIYLENDGLLPYFLFDKHFFEFVYFIEGMDLGQVLKFIYKLSRMNLQMFPFANLANQIFCTFRIAAEVFTYFFVKLALRVN